MRSSAERQFVVVEFRWLRDELKSNSSREVLMPILPAETCLFPPLLFDIPDQAGRWWVLYTKPNHEKKLARELLRAGTSFFLPLHERLWLKRKQLLRVFLPLFPRYVFLKATNEERFAALRTRSVISCLFVEHQEELLNDLSRLHSLIESGGSLTREPRLQSGTWVEVTHGPLAGLKGKILRRGKRMKFIVEVHFCQCGVSTELEGWMIRPAELPEQAAKMAI
jgi:transcriptional antiterminator RfaH